MDFESRAPIGNETPLIVHIFLSLYSDKYLGFSYMPLLTGVWEEKRRDWMQDLLIMVIEQERQHGN